MASSSCRLEPQHHGRSASHERASRRREEVAARCEWAAAVAGYDRRANCRDSEGGAAIATQPGRPGGRDPGTFDAVAYWLSIVGLYVLQGALWYYPFKAKVFDDELIAPQPIKEQFDGSLIDSFPGTSLSWAILGILQGVIVLALAVSLLRGEFLPQRRKPILLGALALSLVAHALMLFGNSMTSQFDSVASLFTYFVLTVVLIVFVLLLPPYRPSRWLSSLLPG